MFCASVINQINKIKVEKRFSFSPSINLGCCETVWRTCGMANAESDQKAICQGHSWRDEAERIAGAGSRRTSHVEQSFRFMPQTMGSYGASYLELM